MMVRVNYEKLKGERLIFPKDARDDGSCMGDEDACKQRNHCEFLSYWFGKAYLSYTRF